MELLETLSLYEKETKLIQEIKVRIDKLHSKKGLLRRLLISFIVVPFVITIFTLGSPFLGLIPPIAGIFCFIYMSNNAKKYKREILRLDEEIKIIEAKLDNISVIPRKYYEYDIIIEFIDYISSLQAKTLEECISLYHTNMRHQERLVAMYDVQDSIANAKSDIKAEMRRIDRNTRY